ncbi:MAG: N-acetyltransferase family protein [Ferruginibacter sp.]
MQFRDAIIDDLPIIVAIYNSTIAGRMVTADTTAVAVADKVQWFHQHNNNKRPLWVVEDDDKKIIGWVSFQDFYGRPAYNGTAEISIYLDETERGKSYGKKMLEYAIEKSPSLGIHTLLGFIFAQNITSLQLFAKLGFEEWANLKDVAILDDKSCSLKIVGRKINAINN